jgi:hypothetical protein
MKNEICPIIEECIFFNNSFLTSDFVGRTYKKMFCLISTQHKECKRYSVFLETGKQAPEYIMPNSQLSIDEISWKIE